MKNCKIFRLIMLGMVPALGMSGIGCTSSASVASVAFVMSDPFQIENNIGENFIVRVFGNSNVNFNNSDGDNLKVNGTVVKSNEFNLPIEKSYNFKFRVRITNRGIIAGINRIVVQSDVAYNFLLGKTYLVSIEETAGSVTGGALLGAIIPVAFEVVLYEFSEDLKNNNKIGVFSAKKLKDEEF